MKVFSLSFFRSDHSTYETPGHSSRGTFFVNQLPLAIRAFHACYPGWEMWIHHDERVRELPYFKALERMRDAGILKLIPMGESKSLCSSMLWRMAPLWNEEVDIVACRDIDSVPMHRDFKMLDAFENSSGTIHAIHDSESHSGPLMGGMIAVKGKPFRALPDSAKNFEMFPLGRQGDDQRALNAMLYPAMASGLIVHTRRPSLGYACMRAYPVAPQETELDKVVRHIGAPPDSGPKTMELLNRMDYPNAGKILQCEEA
jgi:hypothetical protein